MILIKFSKLWYSNCYIRAPRAAELDEPEREVVIETDIYHKKTS